jgi:hypothetical protein
MSKRTIKTTLGSYVDKRGNPTYGWQGDEVDVHEDYLEEFDAMNVDNGSGEPVEYERVGVEVVSPGTSDKKSGPAPGAESPKKAAPAKKST